MAAPARRAGRRRSSAPTARCRGERRRACRTEVCGPRPHACRDSAGCVLVWFALVAPDRAHRLTPARLPPIPVEGLVLVAAALVLPRRARQVVAALVGVAARRPDCRQGPRHRLLRGARPAVQPGHRLGHTSVRRSGCCATRSAATGAVAAVVVALRCSPSRSSSDAAVGAAADPARRHGTGGVDPRRRGARRGLGRCAPCSACSRRRRAGRLHERGRARLRPGPRRSARPATTEQIFAPALAADAVRRHPAGDLLTGLRGKDVIVAFVESYGRVAVQGSSFSPGVDAVLDAGTQTAARGRASRRAAPSSTSPTFGGISWLAHSTLQSGLWVDNQQRYDQLVASNRFTLSDAFKRAGWRTVADVPSNEPNWPEGTSFYHYDKTLQRPQRRLRGPDVQLRHDARPVHPRGVPAPGAGEARPRAR